MRRWIAGSLLVLLVLWSGPAMGAGASWYVNKNATGAGDGTSWQNAWTGFSRVVWGTSGVKAGDSLFISGGPAGTTYTETLTVGASGTASAPIRIRIGQDAGHNGRALFNGVGIGLNSKSYVHIDGDFGGLNRIAIAGVDIGINNGVNGHVIKNVDLDNTGMGISITGVDNEIHHNRLTNQNGGTGVYAAIRIWGGRQAFDANRVHDNEVHVLVSPTNGYGPDGIQTSSGTSVYNNRFTVSRAAVALPTPEHPDVLQCSDSSYLKIYGNDFLDVGDAVIQLGVWFNYSYNNIWIYNNVFRIVHELDTWPEYIRLYVSGGYTISAINNLKILNNVFVDNRDKYIPIRIHNFGGNPTGSGNEIKNNIFYNMGTSSSNPVVLVGASTGWTADSFQFANNVYASPSGALPYLSYNGQTFSLAQWKNAKEPTAITSAPLFVSYTMNGPANDFHLAAGDAAARDKGVSLASYFTIDKDGVARPQGAAWDVGAFEFKMNGPPVRKADFNGDAKADLLFRHPSSGQVLLWLMN